jgi:hypothetical protein
MNTLLHRSTLELVFCTAIFLIAATVAWAADDIVQTDRRPPRLVPAKREFRVEKRYLAIPIKNGAAKRLVTAVVDGGPTVKNTIELADAEPGTFYLTDFLAWHFERLVLQGLGIDRHPELMPLYFGNYKRLVYLSQMESPERLADAQAAARRLGLEFEHRVTGYGGLEHSLRRAGEGVVFWQN